MLFFVYGTLKRDHHNHHLLQHSKYLGQAALEPKYTMVSVGGYPAVFENGSENILGEVYEVEDEKTIKRIFALESCIEKGHPNNYYDITEVDTPYGKASMFIFPPEKFNFYKDSIVKGGEW